MKKFMFAPFVVVALFVAGFAPVRATQSYAYIETPGTAPYTVAYSGGDPCSYVGPGFYTAFTWQGKNYCLPTNENGGQSTVAILD